ncbi:transcriptional regulator [bacterium SCSIO 12643]|nr:transcriptional regulator [bacterium SCSIO 12643]
MNNPIQKLDKAFNNKIRLGIMSALAVNDFLDFKALKNLLEVTDGNLASHTSALEKLDYIQISKSFIGKKPNTKYVITSKGKKAFNSHLEGLEEIIKATSS